MQTRNNNKCKNFRDRLYQAVSSRINLNANWIQNHVANCPKCQRRLSSSGKVSLALSIIKSQPHSLDLLMRANAQAIGVLKRSLRNSPKAKKLKVILPEPQLLERTQKYKSSFANVAACIAILVLMKISVFSFMDKLSTEGNKAVKNYYVKQVGQDIADDVFPV